MYKSSHFDQPNILAHVRFNERTDADGKKTLFIEEIQSDWHQEGRKKGYVFHEAELTDKQRREELIAYATELGNKYGVNTMHSGRDFWSRLEKAGATSEEIMKYKELSSARVSSQLDKEGAVPDAPFKKTWEELALKRMLRYATENGFDSISWTTGEQQADRYDLSKQVDEIGYEKYADGRYELMIGPKDNSDPINKIVEEKELPDIVGKEIADKIIQNEGKSIPSDSEILPGGKRLDNVDLKVGGEPMKKFYDQKIRNIMQKLVKKHGAKVGAGEINTGKLRSDETFVRSGVTEIDYPGGEKIPVHSVTLTPALKDYVMQGQPLFQIKRSYRDKLEKIAKTDTEKADIINKALGIQARLDSLRKAGVPLFVSNEDKEWIEKSAEYLKSVDPDLLCQKSEGCDIAINRLKTRLGDKYSSDMGWEVFTRAKADGLKIPCPQCYVFWARKKPGGAMQKKFVVGVGGYNGEITRMKGATLQAIVDRGLRHYSSTDFKAEHIPGLIIQMMHQSDAGIPTAGYTKDFDFVEMFGPTGAYINVSVGRNGEIGADMTKALEARSKYENVSTIYVAFNDAEVLDAMRNPDIDHVIPWHSSGAAKADMQKILNDESTKDYTDVQNETFIIDGKRVSVTGKKAVDMGVSNIPEKAHGGDLKTYIDLVKKRKKKYKGYEMKFPDLYNRLGENEKELYMKLIGPEYGKYAPGRRDLGDGRLYLPPDADKINTDIADDVINRRAKVSQETNQGYIDIADKIISEVNSGQFELAEETVLVQGQFPIEEEVKDRIAKSQRSMYQTPEEKMGENPELAISQLRKFLKDNEVSVSIVDSIEAPDGRQAFGVYNLVEQAIKFSKTVGKDTGYHEGFHAYINLFLSPEAQTNMFSEARKINPNLRNNLQAEEWLADAFSEYAMNYFGKNEAGAAKTWSAKLVQFFNRLMRKLQVAIGLETGYNSLFQDIVEGRRPRGAKTEKPDDTSIDIQRRQDRPADQGSNLEYDNLSDAKNEARVALVKYDGDIGKALESVKKQYDSMWAIAEKSQFKRGMEGLLESLEESISYLKSKQPKDASPKYVKPKPDQPEIVKPKHIGGGQWELEPSGDRFKKDEAFEKAKDINDRRKKAYEEDMTEYNKANAERYQTRPHRTLTGYILSIGGIDPRTIKASGYTRQDFKEYGLSHLLKKGLKDGDKQTVGYRMDEMAELLASEGWIEAKSDTNAIDVMMATLQSKEGRKIVSETEMERQMAEAMYAQAAKDGYSEEDIDMALQFEPKLMDKELRKNNRKRANKALAYVKRKFPSVMRNSKVRGVIQRTTGQAGGDEARDLRLKMRVAQKAAREGFKEGRKGIKNRRALVRSIREQFNLSDSEMKQITKKDINLMSDVMFKNHLQRLRIKAEEVAEKRRIKNQIQYQIESKNLKKVDNLRKALKFKTIENMSLDELETFDNLLEEFYEGDVFLTQRQIETVDNTELSGIKTLREARERLAKRTGVSVEEVSNMKVSEVDRFRYDVPLAKRNPLYKMLVEDTHRGFIEAEYKYIEFEREVNRLTKAARKSRKRGLVERAIPTDEIVFDYLESKNKEALEEKMTPEELELALYLQQQYAKALRYLIQTKALKTGRENYITNVRRGFFEALKTDGLMAAAKEMLDTQKLDEQTFDILDQATDQILPLEKFFQFAMKRTGHLAPSKNVAKASSKYFRTLFKKQAELLRSVATGRDDVESQVEMMLRVLYQRY